MSVDQIINEIKHDYFKRIVNEQYTSNEKKERVLRELYNSVMSYYVPNYDLRNDVFVSLLLDELQLVSTNKSHRHHHRHHHHQQQQQRPSRHAFGSIMYDFTRIRTVHLHLNVPMTEIPFSCLDTDYYINGHCYDLHHSLWQGNQLCECIAYDKMYRRHHDFKQEYSVRSGYPEDYTHNPAFCELMYKRYDMNFSFFYKYSVLYGVTFLERIVEYVEQTNPCFTMFDYSYSLRYSSDPQTQERVYSSNGNETSTHSIAIIIYRSDNNIQIYAIENNKLTKPHLKSTLDITNNLLLKVLVDTLKANSNLNWNTPYLIANHQFNTSANDAYLFDKKGYCGLVTMFFLDVFHRNIFINNAFEIGNGGTSPSEQNVRHYIETGVELLYNNFARDRKKWWMFLCNYTRYSLELILFEDPLKSLIDYDADFLRSNGMRTEPFKIRNFMDILNTRRYNKNTDYVNVILKRYITTRRPHVYCIGFCFDNEESNNSLFNGPQQSNCFEYFIPQLDMRSWLPLDQIHTLPTPNEMQLVHIWNENITLSIRNSRQNISVTYDNGYRTEDKDPTRIKMLFFNFDDGIDNLLKNRQLNSIGNTGPFVFHSNGQDQGPKTKRTKTTHRATTFEQRYCNEINAKTSGHHSWDLIPNSRIIVLFNQCYDLYFLCRLLDNSINNLIVPKFPIELMKKIIRINSEDVYDIASAVYTHNRVSNEPVMLTSVLNEVLSLVLIKNTEFKNVWDSRNFQEDIETYLLHNSNYNFFITEISDNNKTKGFFEKNQLISSGQLVGYESLVEADEAAYDIFKSDVEANGLIEQYEQIPKEITGVYQCKREYLIPNNVQVLLNLVRPFYKLIVTSYDSRATETHQLY